MEVGLDVPVTVAVAPIINQHILPDQLQVSEEVEDSGINEDSEIDIVGAADSNWLDDD